jgi:hypothetical protein
MAFGERLVEYRSENGSNIERRLENGYYMRNAVWKTAITCGTPFGKRLLHAEHRLENG